jgi:hypothetical protein
MMKQAAFLLSEDLLQPVSNTNLKTE